ncbi:hypothetical protein ACFQV2_29905 [Actinokineospora soli]|uniref:Methyltransferase domain-containing protein n=1 Tax=Actinokineospora soli TaxID=1048753 RepID=A0ABW2TV75_9PSEU
MVSSTALHWLEHDELAAVFATAAARLRPGGVLVNADNMHLPGPLRAYGEHVRRSHAVRAGTTDNEDWRAWWEAVLADVDPETAAAHNALAISHDSSSDLTVTGYTDLLLRGGFSAAGPVWQVGDDHVLVAVR